MVVSHTLDGQRVPGHHRLIQELKLAIRDTYFYGTCAFDVQTCKRIDPTKLRVEVEKPFDFHAQRFLGVR